MTERGVNYLDLRERRPQVRVPVSSAGNRQSHRLPFPKIYVDRKALKVRPK